MGFIEQEDAELGASVNKHWREEAEYERFVKPLIVRLHAVDWAAVMAIHKARWHRQAIAGIREAKRAHGSYCWTSRYYNPLSKTGRMIQRYPIMYEGFPIRLCPPEGPPESWGFWFRTSDLKSSDWTLESHAWHEYESGKQATCRAYESMDAERRNNVNPRQYLAERLRSASKRLGKYVRQDYLSANGIFYEEPYELDWALYNALSSSPKYRALSPYELGEVEARLEYFRLCLKEFYEAEKPLSAVVASAAPFNGKSILLTPAELRNFYLKALEHPTFIDELTLYQTSELLKYAKDVYWQACDLAAELLDNSAEYPYPNEYKGGKEFDYWLERQSTVAESQKVQALCTRRLEAMPHVPQPAKGTPGADVRRYFPKAANVHGTTVSDTNALQQLAVWLLHWAERPDSKRYSLPGQLRKQMAAHPDAAKFLKACRRLHEALTPLAATEQETKSLLGKEYRPNSRTNLQAVLTWWAGWIREQSEVQRHPARAYLAALKRMPIVEEQENGTPRYSIPIHLMDWDGFAADIAPLRQAFDDALPDLSPDQKRALRHDVGALLRIDSEQLKRQQQRFDKQEYFPANLPADYPNLRFEVAGQPGGLSHAHQWVSSFFWSGLRALLHYKQIEARDAFEKLNAALGEFEPELPNPAQFISQPQQLSVGGHSWAEIEAVAEKIELRKKGKFTLSNKWIPQAVAGFIDALREAGIVSATSLPTLYSEFTEHYGQKIASDRVTNTRTKWQNKARQALGLD